MFQEIKINWIAESEVAHDGLAFQFPKSVLRNAIMYLNSDKKNVILNFLDMYLQTKNNDYIRLQIKSTHFMINTFIPNGIIYITLIGG